MSPQTECMRNVMKDLTYYEAAIKSYLKSPLRSPEKEEACLRPTLEIIKSLKVCLSCVCGKSGKKQCHDLKTEIENLLGKNI